jgi:curved DNA-binding protein
MAAKDYYEVLGVSRTATEDEIRKAYRKLARQYHPDVNKAADAQKRFTEVQEAYDVLSDARKRQMYDQTGRAEGPRTGPGGRGPHYSWTNVGGGRGGEAEVDLEDLGSMFEAFFGGKGGGGGFGDFGPFGSGGGGRAAAGGRRGRARPGAGGREGPVPAAEHELTVSFMTAAKGGEERLRLVQDGKTRTIDVSIPKGLNDGSRLRVRGAGGVGDAAADLILTVRIGQHPLLRRSEFPNQPAVGLDLYIDLPLTIAEATLGATVTIPTLEGTVELSVPAGSASGRKLRLRGRGVEDAHGKKGDLYAIVKIVPPDGSRLSDEDAAALERIAAKGPNPPPPRSATGWTHAV